MKNCIKKICKKLLPKLGTIMFFTGWSIFMSVNLIHKNIIEVPDRLVISQLSVLVAFVGWVIGITGCLEKRNPEKQIDKSE